MSCFSLSICLPAWCCECYWTWTWINGMDFFLTAFNLDVVEDYLAYNVNPSSNGLGRLHEYQESWYDESPRISFDRIWTGRNSLLSVRQLPRLRSFQNLPVSTQQKWYKPLAEFISQLLVTTEIILFAFKMLTVVHLTLIIQKEATLNSSSSWEQILQVPVPIKKLNNE